MAWSSRVLLSAAPAPETLCGGPQSRTPEPHPASRTAFKTTHEANAATVAKRGKLGGGKSLRQLQVLEGWKSLGLERSFSEDGSLQLGSVTDWALSDFSQIRVPALLSGQAAPDAPDTAQEKLRINVSGNRDLHSNHLLRASGSVAGLQSPPPPRQKQESEHKDDYYVNIGYAIRSLRDELPSLFYKDLNYDIYRDDITFRDPLNAFSGINNYRLVYWALRFHGRIFFKALWVDVVRIWQPCDKVIMVRWSVRGMPRVPWESQGHFDGTSEYKLDKEGNIYEHKVDNVVMNGYKPFKFSSIWEAILSSRTTASPTFYHTLQQFINRISPYFVLFTWVRFYFALAGTMALNKNRQLSPGDCQ